MVPFEFEKEKKRRRIKKKERKKELEGGWMKGIRVRHEQPVYTYKTVYYITEEGRKKK